MKESSRADLSRSRFATESDCVRGKDMRPREDLYPARFPTERTAQWRGAKVDIIRARAKPLGGPPVPEGRRAENCSAIHLELSTHVSGLPEG